jgi:adenylate cyclase
MVDLSGIITWLIDGVPGARTPEDVVARLCREIVDAGLPLASGEAFVRTLHPHVVGRSFHWTPGQPVEVLENSYAYLNSAAFQDGPVAAVVRDGRPVRRRLDDPRSRGEFAALDRLAEQGFTDYYAGPLRFLGGDVHALTLATRAAGGFSDEQIAAVERILAPLSRITEIFALTRTAANLLDTYVGHNAGSRILAGQILRGDTETLRAVLWFSDLRGFTSMSASLLPGELIRVLNDLFDCQVPAIERHGGEVLKFMGDGLLAILPVEGTNRTPRDTCDAALAAADEAFAALARLNARRGGRGSAPIEFGLALHVGEVAYGNIGGSGRLDFTCIGPAVNLAARLESLTGRLHRTVVASVEFARLTTRPLESLGLFELRGVPEPTEVFAPG